MPDEPPPPQAGAMSPFAPAATSPSGQNPPPPPPLPPSGGGYTLRRHHPVEVTRPRATSGAATTPPPPRAEPDIPPPPPPGGDTCARLLRRGYAPAGAGYAGQRTDGLAIGVAGHRHRLDSLLSGLPRLILGPDGGPSWASYPAEDLDQRRRARRGPSPWSPDPPASLASLPVGAFFVWDIRISQSNSIASPRRNAAFQDCVVKIPVLMFPGQAKTGQAIPLPRLLPPDQVRSLRRSLASSCWRSSSAQRSPTSASTTS